MSDVAFSPAVRVQIDLGKFEGETVWQYFVDLIFADDTRCGMSNRYSHDEAMQDAIELAEEEDLPIIDLTSGRLQ